LSGALTNCIEQSSAHEPGEIMPFILEQGTRHRNFIIDYEPQIDRRMDARISLGIELNAEERAQLPRRVHVGSGPSRTLTFIYGMLAGPFILPPAAHAILMELEPEPEGHVFHELEAMADGVSLGPHFLQLQTPVVDCVDIDRTTYYLRQGREYYEKMMSRPPDPGSSQSRISLQNGQQTYLHASAIAGRHWWRAPERFSWKHFCSKELKERFSKAKIAGLRFDPCNV
jgi:hypothetical protein